MTSLILINDAREADLWRWTRVGDDGRKIAAGRAYSHVLPQGSNERVVVVLPGETVRGRRIELPAKTDAQARAALPYLLGDELGDGAATLHFILGEAGDGGRAIYWTESAPLAARLAALEARGLVPDLVTADFLALPPAPAPYVVSDGSRAVKVTPDRAGGYAVEAALLPLLDPALPAEAIVTLDPEACDARLIAGLACYQGPDFRQGAFAPRRAWGDMWLVWRRTAALALLLLMVAGLAVMAEGYKARSLADEIDAATRAALKNAFPGVRSLPHLQARMKALRAGGADPFLDLSARLFAAIEAIDGVTMTGLRYDRTGKSLTAAIAAASFGDIEKLKALAAERGLTLTEGASRQEGGRIVSDISVGDRS